MTVPSALTRNKCASQILFKESRRCISSAGLTIERTTNLERFQNRPAKEDLAFGKTLSDHMLMIEWNKGTNWGAPRIVPYQDLKISPAASVLHYGERSNSSIEMHDNNITIIMRRTHSFLFQPIFF